jgi:WD40 repeat protein
LHQEAQFPLNDIRFSPDGTLLATVMMNGKAEIWDATTGDNQLILPGIARDPCALAISPDNSRLLVVTCAGQLQLWGISSEYSREWLTLPDEGGNVSVSPDGKLLATRDSSGNAVSVRDAASGQLQLTLTGHTDTIWDLAFSPDGTRLVTASFDKTAKVWDTGTGIEILTLEGHTDALWSVAYSPNGDQIATIGYDKTARLWDADSGQLLFTLDAYSEPISYTITIGVAFSPDGRNLATAGSGPLKIWDTDSGELLLTMPLSGERAAAVAYSPDGKYLAIGMAGGPASVWQVASGQKLFDLPDHTATVVDIAFSPDGTHIATTSTDRTVKVWDATTGQLQLTLPDHNPFANALAFSPDGTRLITASDGFGGIRVWALDLDNLVQIARSRLTRELTTEECQQYLHLDGCPGKP